MLIKRGNLDAFFTYRLLVDLWW